MPGKHAPPSPRSFYLSVARAVAGALAVLTLVVLIAMAAVNSGDDPKPAAQNTKEPRTSATPTVTTSETPTVEVTPTKTKTARAVRPRSRISVLVLNATNQAGLAARTRDRLLEAGYEDVEIGDTTDRAESIVYYRGKSFRREAARLRRDVDSVEEVDAAPDDLEGEARLTLILGADFEG